MEKVLFRETMTLGVRKYRATRSILPPEETVTTVWGPVRGKVAWFSRIGRSFPLNSRTALGLREKRTYRCAKSGAAQKAYARN